MSAVAVDLVAEESAPWQWTREVPAFALLASAWFILLFYVGVGGDFPLNDDWAYAASARHLATTGRVHILDWAAPSLVSHIAWGAGLIKIFGPSYVVLRLGTFAWGLCGIFVLYAIARAADLEPRRAILLPILVGFSPWYVNLSFTYMTDVPWMVWMLGAVLILLRNPGGRVLGHAAAGLCVAASALSRQFAIVVIPAFCLIIFLDARRDAVRRRLATIEILAFCLPVVVLYGCFHYWYEHIHGPTLANRLTLQRIGELRPWHPTAHILATWHYVGFWLLPFVIAALVASRGSFRPFVDPKRAAIATILLVGYGIAAVIGTLTDATPNWGAGASFPPTFPYLGNVVYLLGAGPPTIFSVYRGHEAPPHAHHWVGWILSICSTVGGVVALRFLARGWKDGLAFVRGARRSTAGLRARTLLVGVAILYLGWHFSTAKFLFDRYLLFVMPVAVLLALDALPKAVTSSSVVWLALAPVILFGVVATREYLNWNAARDLAVRTLEARGVSADEIDGGVEINGPRHFEHFFATTGQIVLPDGRWFLDRTRFRISFWPSSADGCKAIERFPFSTWFGAGSSAIYVLDCKRTER